MDPNSISDVQIRLLGDQRGEQFVVDAMDGPVDRAGAVGLWGVHVGAGANAIERCLAVAGFDETGESRPLGALRREQVRAASITKNWKYESVQSEPSPSLHARDTPVLSDHLSRSMPAFCSTVR